MLGRLADPVWGGPWEAREGGPALCLLAGTDGLAQRAGARAGAATHKPCVLPHQAVWRGSGTASTSSWF